MHLYGQCVFCKASFPGKIDDGMVGANINTFAAGSAFMIINHGKVILHVDSVIWAYLLAPLAGDTRILANLLCGCTLIKRFTTHVYHL